MDFFNLQTNWFYTEEIVEPDYYMLEVLEKYHPSKYIVFLFLMVGINYICYLILDNLLKRHSMKYKIIEFHDKRYVVKNLTKSMILLILILAGLPGFWTMIVTGTWNNDLVHTIGTIYVSTDVSGLIFVPRLPKETLIHHTCVVILGTVNVFMDYSVNGLHRALISLTILSMVPYLVNTYLGMRHLEGTTIKRCIVGICLWVYSASVVVNLILQHLYVFYLVPGFLNPWILCKKIAYLAIYYSILNDDIKLIRYLNYKYMEDRTMKM